MIVQQKNFLKERLSIVSQQKNRGGGKDLPFFSASVRARPWRFNFIGIYDERKY